MIPAEARYLQVAETLRRQIETLGPNSLLPTEQQLAKQFGVSRVTVRRALGLLERSGLVSRQRGRGTIVNPPKVTRRFSPLYTFEEDFKQQGIKIETRIVEYHPKSTPPEFIRERLRLPAGGSVGFLSLMRLVEGRIIAHDRRHFPSAVAVRFDPLLVQDRPVSDVLGELAGLPITGVDWESEIIPSSREVANVLGITPGTLIVANTFTYYLENGSPIEAGVMSYRVDRCKFKLAGRFGKPLLWGSPSPWDYGQATEGGF